MSNSFGWKQTLLTDVPRKTKANASSFALLLINSFSGEQLFLIDANINLAVSCEKITGGLSLNSAPVFNQRILHFS